MLVPLQSPSQGLSRTVKNDSPNQSEVFWGSGPTESVVSVPLLGPPNFYQPLYFHFVAFLAIFKHVNFNLGNCSLVLDNFSEILQFLKNLQIILKKNMPSTSKCGILSVTRGLELGRDVPS